MKSLIIIGGGAAGMLAACVAAGDGCEVTLIERNEKLGKKVFITGKGRCNITNDCTVEDFLLNVVTNSKFMYSSIYGFTPQDTVNFFEGLGLKTKTERGNRVFPVSDHSSDVIKVLANEMQRRKVNIRLGERVKGLITDDNGFAGVITDKGEKIYADSCIVATGGKSYPVTGSDGDGYGFAEEAGHKIKRLLPALVGLETKEKFVKELEGLSLRNVSAAIYINNKEKFSELGEMLFTHNGVSGPLVLTASSLFADEIESGKGVKLRIDLKPGLTKDELDARILKDFSENLNRQFKNALSKLLPGKLIPVVVGLSGIDPDKRVNEVTKNERQNLVALLKGFELNIEKSCGFTGAVITKGGVYVKEINPATMESKLVPGLYFAGEIIDVDALTGGYNLQIAWSTAYAAAKAVSCVEY